jgi:hypothetical protein
MLVHRIKRLYQWIFSYVIIVLSESRNVTLFCSMQHFINKIRIAYLKKNYLYV